MAGEPNIDAIRAAIAAATPAPWAEGYVQWAVRHIARNCDYDPADESEPDFCWDRYNDWPVVANAPVWLTSLCTEVERLRAERGIWFRYLCTNGHHTISRKDDLTTCSAKTMTWSCHAPMVPYDGDETIDGLVAERDAALDECERLRAEVDGLLDELSRCQCERVGES